MSSQSLAPQIIRIKRKRDDAPLESLVLEDEPRQGKRRVTESTFIFKRIVKATAEEQRQQATPLQDDGVPRVKATAPGEERRDPLALHQQERSTTKPRLAPPQLLNGTPRRFQLSRPANGSPLPISPAGRRKKQDVAVFVESKREQDVKTLEGVAEQIRVEAVETRVAQITEDATAQDPAPSRSLKRPTPLSHLSARNGRAHEQPNGQDVQHDRDPKVTSEMEEWARETERAEQTSVTQTSIFKPTPSISEPIIRGSDEDVDMHDVDDNGDYVYDTYIRHLVSSSSAASMENVAGFGHLVIGEEDQELWRTYVDDDDEDEKECDTDEEDSNAEDYYGADYPEDEVDGEDEYDRAAYRFRRGASDDEEYGTEDDEGDGDEDEHATFSDDEDEDGIIETFTGGIGKPSQALLKN